MRRKRVWAFQSWSCLERLDLWQFILKKLNWALEEDKAGSGVKISYGWLKKRELEDKSIIHLPLFAKAAIEVSKEAGILPIFLTKELKQLEKSSKKFSKAAKKRGV